MYSNNRLVYDEKTEAEYYYTHAFEGEFTWRKVLLICKYMVKELGYGKAKTKTQIIQFCEEKEPNFNYISNRKRINGIVSSATKDDYKITLPVSIRVSELEIIKTIKNFKYQKIVLCALFLLKQSPHKKGISAYDFGKIRVMMNKKHLSNEDIQKVFGLLNAKGYIGEPHGYYPLLFISDNKQDTPVFILENKDHWARGLVGYYVNYCGGELGYCKECGAEFVKSSQHHLYCTKHTLEKTKKRWSKASRNYRAKTVIV
jgi:hypothetical protein